MTGKETGECLEPGKTYSGETVEWNDIHRRLDETESLIESGWESSAEEVQALLKRRAEALARVRRRDAENADCISVVEFLLGDEKYGIEASCLQEVYPLREFTPLPGTPAFILGIINLRGKIISVMNIKKFFGLPDKGITELNRVLIVKRNNMETGILADNVLGIKGINPEELRPAMDTLTGINGDYLRGITTERLIVLDLARILDDPDIIVTKDTHRGQNRGGR